MNEFNLLWLIGTAVGFDFTFNVMGRRAGEATFDMQSSLAFSWLTRLPEEAEVDGWCWWCGGGSIRLSEGEEELLDIISTKSIDCFVRLRSFRIKFPFITISMLCMEWRLSSKGPPLLVVLLTIGCEVKDDEEDGSCFSAGCADCRWGDDGVEDTKDEEEDGWWGWWLPSTFVFRSPPWA